MWGPLTLSTPEQVRVDIAFIGATSINIQRGITEPDFQGAQMKRALLGIGQQTVLIAGHHKIGTESPALVVPLQEIDAFVTTGGIADDDLASIQALGIRVLTFASSTACAWLHPYLYAYDPTAIAVILATFMLAFHLFMLLSTATCDGSGP